MWKYYPAAFACILGLSAIYLLLYAHAGSTGTSMLPWMV
jgi:hypothetical protein